MCCKTSQICSACLLPESETCTFTGPNGNFSKLFQKFQDLACAPETVYFRVFACHRLYIACTFVYFCICYLPGLLEGFQVVMVGFSWPGRPSEDPRWRWEPREGFEDGKFVLIMDPIRPEPWEDSPSKGKPVSKGQVGWVREFGTSCPLKF